MLDRAHLQKFSSTVRMSSTGVRGSDHWENQIALILGGKKWGYIDMDTFRHPVTSNTMYIYFWIFKSHTALA